MLCAQALVSGPIVQPTSPDGGRPRLGQLAEGGLDAALHEGRVKKWPADRHGYNRDPDPPGTRVYPGPG